MVNVYSAFLDIQSAQVFMLQINWDTTATATSMQDNHQSYGKTRFPNSSTHKTPIPAATSSRVQPETLLIILTYSYNHLI